MYAAEPPRILSWISPQGRSPRASFPSPPPSSLSFLSPLPTSWPLLSPFPPSVCDRSGRRVPRGAQGRKPRPHPLVGRANTQQAGPRRKKSANSLDGHQCGEGTHIALGSKRQSVGTQNATRAALGARVQKLHAPLACGAGYSPTAVPVSAPPSQRVVCPRPPLARCGAHT